MSRTDCPSLETLSAFALGELPEPELSAVAEHLDNCTECEEQAGRLDGLADPVVAELRRFPNLHTDEPDTELDGSRETSSVPESVESWGEFSIVREIGRGGMGVVCEAYQGSLNRHVALKFLPEQGDLARFRREARAAGRLHHTNIVPVFGVGEQQGRHFYVMQFIAGRGLDVVVKERADSGGPSARFDDREAARIGIQVAEALAYAHSQGVIHRDIKPSNLLLDDQGTVWVADFGLAHDASNTLTLTQTGDFLGSLRYVAPERFSGRGDKRADIYGLGVTLYELMCGRPAHSEADRSVLVHQILHQDPPRPRQIQPTIARDLETIVVKAMEREPAQRYATAEALAEDLRRFLDDRTIRARRVGPWERAWRWSRRNKAVAGLLLAMVVTFVMGCALGAIEWRRVVYQLAQAESLRIQARVEIAVQDLDKGLEIAHGGDVDYGLLWMAEAVAKVPPERPGFATMARTTLAAWESPLLRRRAILEHPEIVYHARFSPDGRAIMTHGEEKVVRLWDAASGRPLAAPLEHPMIVNYFVFSPDGRLVATGCDGGGIVRIWDAVTGQVMTPSPALDLRTDGWRRVYRLEFSADGRLLLGRDEFQGTRLWDVATGRSIRLPQEDESIRSARLTPERPSVLIDHDNTNPLALFSPDGCRLLLLAPSHRQVRICDTASGALIGPPIGAEGLRWAGYSPDGRLIGTANPGGTAQLWDAVTGSAVDSFWQSAGGFDSATFSPDSRRLLVVSNDHTAQLWEIADGRPVGSPLRHERKIRCGVFSPDGRRIVTASDDGTARVWDAVTGLPVASPLRHEREVWDASFSPDGRRIATASFDKTAQVWELGRGDLAPIGQRPVRPNRIVDGITEGGVYKRLCHATIDRTGTRVLISGDHMARLVDVDSGEPIGRPMTQQDWSSGTIAAFSPDGRRIASANRDVVIYEVEADSISGAIPGAPNGATGRSNPLLLPHFGAIWALAFSPDGKVLATGQRGGIVLLWDTGTGTRIGQPFDAGADVVSMAFSPDGRLLAAGCGPDNPQAFLWDLASGQVLGDRVRFKGDVACLAFSRDGSTLAAGSRDGSTQVIDTATGLVRVELHQVGLLNGVTFSPDGRLILTTSIRGDMTDARLWDASTGVPATPMMTHPGRSRIPAVFKPDGSAFAVSSGDHTIRLWDVSTARPLGVVGTLRNECFAMAFRPDGQSLVAVELPGIVHKWPIPEPSVGTVADLFRHVQLLTDRELDFEKSPVALSSAKRRQLRAQANDASFVRETTDEAVWHETNARDAEAAGDSSGLRWHLDRLIAARPDDGLLHARRARAALWADDVASAEADLERAINLGPRDRIFDWMLHRAEDFRYEGRPEDVIRLLDRIITVRPDDWLTYVQRAEMLPFVGRDAEYRGDIERALARGGDIAFLIRIADERSLAGRWAEAVPLWDRAIALGPVPYCVWQWATIAHLERDDEDGFRRVCRILRDRLPAVVDERRHGETLANILSLGPGGVGDDGKALGWIEAVLATTDAADGPLKSRSLCALGAVLYRLGRYREAIDRIQEGIALGGNSGVPPEGAVFLAMAHFRLGDTNKARSLLASPGDDETQRQSVDRWWAGAHLRLLRREAARLILDSPFPTDPFAP